MTTKISDLERGVRVRLDALPEGWGSESFRDALIAEARAKSPGPELETLAVSSKAEAAWHLEQLDVPAAVEAMKTRVAAELLLESWHPPAVDMSPVEREIDACVQRVARLAEGVSLPELFYQAAARSFENLPPEAQKELGIPRSTDADLAALARIEALRDALRGFLTDLNLYRRHRSETDPIQMVAIAAELTARRPAFDEPLREVAALIEKANASHPTWGKQPVPA